MSETESSEDGYNPLDKRRTKCTDLLFTILFFGYWIGMLVVSIVAVSYGDPGRLVYASDYLGNTCGKCVGDSFSCGKSIYYPDPGSDAIAQGISVLDVDFVNGFVPSIDLFGICVENCPSAGDYVCLYDIQNELGNNLASTLENCYSKMLENNQGISNNFGFDALGTNCKRYVNGCWYVGQNQTDVAFRCISEVEISSSSSSTCEYPKYQDSAKTIEMPVTVCPDEVDNAILNNTCNDDVCFERSGKTCIKNTRCVFEAVETVSEQVVSSSSASPQVLVLGTLGSWTANFRRSLADLQETWWTVFVTSVIGAIVLGLTWNQVLRFSVGIFIWLMIVLSVVGLGVCSLICFVKSGMVANQLNWLGSVAGDPEFFVQFQGNQSDSVWWSILAWILLVVMIIYILILIILRRKISIAVAILEEASRAIQTMKFGVFVPLFNSLWMVLLLVYGFTIFAYICTSGTVIPTNITASGLVMQIQMNHQRQLLDQGDLEATTDLILQKVVGGSSTVFLALYHVMGCFWTFEVLSGVSTMTIGGAVASWYWTRDKSGRHFSVTKSYLRTMFFHFGSVCFGALLVAIFRLFRVIVEYIANKTRKLQDDNRIVKVIILVLQCCLFCFEKWLKFISSYAYVIVIMKSTGYCRATRETFKLLVNNLGRVATVHAISRLIQFLSILVITCACVSLEWLWLEYDSRFQYGGKNAITSSFATLLVTGVLSFWIAAEFMSLYSTAVTTILLSFCIDADKNKDSKNYYMTDHLKSYFARKGRGKNKKKKSKKTSVVSPEPS